MCNRNNNSSYNNFSNNCCSGYNNDFSGGGYSNMSYNTTNMSYGYTYVPYQPFNNIFSPSVGLENGTMFPELVSPYYPNQSLETMNYLRNNSNNGGCCR